MQIAKAASKLNQAPQSKHPFKRTQNLPKKKFAKVAYTRTSTQHQRESIFKKNKEAKEIPTKEPRNLAFAQFAVAE